MTWSGFCCCRLNEGRFDLSLWEQRTLLQLLPSNVVLQKSQKIGRVDSSINETSVKAKTALSNDEVYESKCTRMNWYAHAYVVSGV